MTTRDEQLTTTKKVVVFFDMCSSSAILEDLSETDNLAIFRNVLLAIRDFLRTRSAPDDFIPYKFIGDGWVLLFPANVSGRALVNCLARLSESFAIHFRHHVAPNLQRTPKVVGLTFGVDKGKLIKIVMNEQVEFIGRALNVASRLQGAIKDKDKKPSYKVLFSRHTYEGLNIDAKVYKIQGVKRSLRNIHGGREMKFVKLTLPITQKS